MNIIYAGKKTDTKRGQIIYQLLKEVVHKLKKNTRTYGIIHGNGGIGEIQGSYFKRNRRVKQEGVHVKLFYKGRIFLFVFLAVNACSINYEKDIQFIRKNLERYQAETIPYRDKITFTLSTEQMLAGIVEPIKITSIHDTDVFVVESFERENTINKKREIYLMIGLDSQVKPNSGTMLSHFRLNGNDTYTTGEVILRAFNDNGALANFGSGSGDYEGKYGQFFSYVLAREDVINSKEVTFEISGLYLLNYNRI
ncbi:hypothetical protein [Ammoniphilus sp. YIM 78166]|uniref:hypothetical protein n=1 Tax=Ammoniphilus sp. YIM 78166 TaxID=1644106 RepID=UPI0010703A6D|nr:hypothetical protein [Ammoniphilus sp. YIM 78166]